MMKFFKCAHCGKIIAVINGVEVPTICCGEKMAEITVNTVEAALEKHIPVFVREGDVVKVEVGAVAHPMLEKHYIEWVVLETKKGYQMVKLHPEEEPKAEFAVLKDDEVVGVYAYCNLHGLWKA